jgi:hypothetical protein
MNWQEFERLKELTPAGGTFEKPGAAGMKIRVGVHWPGVSLKDHHKAIATRPQLDQIVGDYRYAVRRASEIQRCSAGSHECSRVRDHLMPLNARDQRSKWSTFSSSSAEPQPGLISMTA